VLAQTRNDQNGGGSLQFVHGQHLRFLDNSTGCFRQGLFVESTLKSAHPKRFTLDVMHFSFDDKLSDTFTPRPLVEKSRRLAQGHCNQRMSADGSMQRRGWMTGQHENHQRHDNCSTVDTLDIVATLTPTAIGPGKTFA
jgi:hypothetical protein